MNAATTILSHPPTPTTCHQPTNCLAHLSPPHSSQDLIAPVLIFQCLEQYDFMGATIIGTVLLAISLVIMLLVNWVQT